MQGRRKVSGLAEHVPEKLPANAPAETEVFEEGGPADVESGVGVVVGFLGGGVVGVTPWEIKFLEVGKLADSLVE